MDLSNDHSNPKGGQNDETTPKDDKQDYSVNSESETSNDESIDESCNEINIYESNDIDDFKGVNLDYIEEKIGLYDNNKSQRFSFPEPKGGGTAVNIGDSQLRLKYPRHGK